MFLSPRAQSLMIVTGITSSEQYPAGLGSKWSNANTCTVYVSYDRWRARAGGALLGRVDHVTQSSILIGCISGHTDKSASCIYRLYIDLAGSVTVDVVNYPLSLVGERGRLKTAKVSDKVAKIVKLIRRTELSMSTVTVYR